MHCTLLIQFSTTLHAIDISWDKNRVDMTFDDKCAAWRQVDSASDLVARKQKLWRFNAPQDKRDVICI